MFQVSSHLITIHDDFIDDRPLVMEFQFRVTASPLGFPNTASAVRLAASRKAFLWGAGFFRATFAYHEGLQLIN